MERYAQEFQDLHQIPYVVGQWMARIYPSLHLDYMLQITTTAKDFI